MEPQNASGSLDNSLNLRNDFNNQSGSFGNFRADRAHFDGGPLDTVEFNAETHPEFKKNYLIKIIPHRAIHETRLNRLTKLCHPNILSHYNVWTASLNNPNDPWEEKDDANSTKTEQRPFLVTQIEFFSDLNLEAFLSSRPPSQSLEILSKYYAQNQQIFTQCLDAFVYLELAGMVHGNLKLEDILVRPGLGEEVQVKIYGLFKVTDDDDIDLDTEDNFILPPHEESSAGEHAGDVYALAIVLISLLVRPKLGESLSDAVGKVVLGLVHRRLPIGLEDYPVESDWILKMTASEKFLRPKIATMKYLVSDVPGYRKSVCSEILKSKVTGVAALLDFAIMVVLEGDQSAEFKIGVDVETTKETDEEPQPGPSSAIAENKFAEPEEPEVIQEQLRQLEEIRESKEFDDLDLLDLYRIEVESSIISLKFQSISTNNPLESKDRGELEIYLAKIQQIITAQTNILNLSPATDFQTLKNFVTQAKILNRLGRTSETLERWGYLQKLFSMGGNEIEESCRIEFDHMFREFEGSLGQNINLKVKKIRWMPVNGLQVKSIKANMRRHLCTMLHDGVPVLGTRDKVLLDNLTRLEELDGDESPCYKSVLQQLAMEHKNKYRPTQTATPEPSQKASKLPLHWQTQKESVLKTDFNLDQVLGGGAFGKVYKGVKLIHTGDKFDVVQFTQGSPEFMKEFAIKIIPFGEISEATLSLQLIHPNIASTYNVWSDNYNPDPKFECASTSSAATSTSTSSYASSGSYPHPNLDNPNYFKSRKNLVIQQELCTGPTLLKFLQTRNPTPDEPTKSTYYAETRLIFTQLLEALVYLEFKEIAHGDLKPDNIILTATNGAIVPKILDFGKANFTIPFATDESDAVLNRSVENRRRYISPEQGKVENSENLGTLGANHKSNVYSLGLMFIPMLVQFKFKISPNSQELVSRDLNHCILEAREDATIRKFPRELDSYPTELRWIQAMLDHDYHTRPAASEVKIMLRNSPEYKTTATPLPADTLSFITNVSTILDKVIEDSESTCKYEKIDIDKEIAKPMTKQGAIQQCITNDLGRYLIQHIHQALILLKADDEIIVKAVRYAVKLRLCSAKDLNYLVQLYLKKIEDELTVSHELYQEFATVLEEVSNISGSSLNQMKQFVGNIFETGVSMQDLVSRLEPNPDPATLEEMISMWSCSGFGSHVVDEAHHENRAEIESALENLGTVDFSRDSGAQGILAKIVNLTTRAQMLNKLGRTDEIDGIMKQMFDSMHLEEMDEGLHAILVQNFGKFLKSFDMKDMMPMVEHVRETEAILKEQIGRANMEKEALKFWNHLDCKCAKCRRMTEESENQVATEILKWSTTLVKKDLPFETRDIDELD